MTHADVPRADPRDYQTYFRFFRPDGRRILLMLTGFDAADLEVRQVIVARIADVEVHDSTVIFQLVIGMHQLAFVKYQLGEPYAFASDGRRCAVVVDTRDALAVELWKAQCELRFPRATVLNAAQL